METICLDILRKDIVKHISLSDYLNLILSCRTLYLKNISTISDQFVQRLVKLFPDTITTAPDIIKTLSTIGVIAGGSVVYALNDFVPSNAVSDIDVFISTKEAFIEASLFLHNTGKVKSIHRRCAKSYNESNWFESTSITVLDFELVAPIVNYAPYSFAYPTRPNPFTIQLIYQEFTSPIDVIRTFDLDYVQCCFSEGRIFRSRECVESHTQRRIKTGYYVPRAKRMSKGLAKGFETTVIGRRSSYDSNRIQIDDLFQSKLVPLGIRQICQPMDLSCVEILKLVRSKHKQRSRSTTLTTLNVIYQISDLEFDGEFISLEIEIVSIEPNRTFCTITPIRLDSEFEINHVSFAKAYPFIQTGKHVVEVSFILSEKSGEPKHILMLAEEFLSPHAGVLKIPGGFKVCV